MITKTIGTRLGGMDFSAVDAAFTWLKTQVPYGTPMADSYTFSIEAGFDGSLTPPNYPLYNVDFGNGNYKLIIETNPTDDIKTYGPALITGTWLMPGDLGTGSLWRSWPT